MHPPQEARSITKRRRLVDSNADGKTIPGAAGAVFSAARSGMLYALSNADGHTLWEFDTAKEFDTVNKVPARGGTMGSAGPTVAGGMLFVGSGYSFGGGDRNGNVLLAFSTQ